MPNKKLEKLFDHIAKKIAWFMGSWWGITVHAIWWAAWFIFRLDFLTLTLWLSIEAILIGMFILMVQNKAEEQRIRLAEIYNNTSLKTIKRDLKLDEKSGRMQKEIIKKLEEVKQDIKKIKQNYKA